jgi:hypothetical protein
MLMGVFIRWRLYLSYLFWWIFCKRIFQQQILKCVGRQLCLYSLVVGQLIAGYFSPKAGNFDYVSKSLPAKLLR